MTCPPELGILSANPGTGIDTRDDHAKPSGGPVALLLACVGAPAPDHVRHLARRVSCGAFLLVRVPEARPVAGLGPALMGQHVIDDRRAEREDRAAYGTFSHTSRGGNPVYRNPWGTPTQAAFRVWLPSAPNGPCSRAQAGAFADAIDRVLDHHDEELTRSEKSSLYRMRKKWRDRQHGRDGRFDALGGVFAGRRPAGACTGADVLAGMRKIIQDEGDPLVPMTDAERYTIIYPEKPAKAAATPRVRRVPTRALYPEMLALQRGIGRLGPKTKQGESHSERIRRLLR